MSDASVPALPVAAFARMYIERHGLALVKLPPGKKYPTHEDWEQPGGYFTDPAEAAAFYEANPKWGVGAVLGPSGLCSLDIDNLAEARIVLSEFGIDVDALADQYPSIVGNPERFRIEFRVPEGVELATHRLQWPDEGDASRSHTVFELRAGLVQDVLPPTLHPDHGKPYFWRTKPASGFPVLPEALITIWREWAVFKENARALCPWAPDVKKPPAAPPARPRTEDSGPSVIEAYNEAHAIGDRLEHYGYKRMGRRYLSPHSKTNLPGVVMLDGNRCWIHHASDPLGGDRPCNPFDLFLHYEHGGDLPAATKAAARELGIAHRTRSELQVERRQAQQVVQPPEPPVEFDPETGEIFEDMPAAQAAEPKRRAVADDGQPFTALGFDKGVFFYMAGGTQQVVALSASAHSKANLLQLAPLHFWEREYPTKTGADWDLAMNALMRQCEARGVFSPNIMRGRGAWYDEGRVVVHLGDRVLVDGHALRPKAVDSRFVYEAALPMRADVSNPLTAEEARKYLALVQMLPWENPMQGTLAAGWGPVAHIGGVLNWRPHMWVIGRRGSGKTWVMTNIFRPILGDNLLHAQGDTTEAGLRQTLGSDALPVLFDEAEGPDQRANERVQNVLSLVRQASSETGGKIYKGTTGGRSMSFDVRSCFVFSSINANLMQQSDRSRVTVVEVNQQHAKHPFADIVKAQADLMTDEFIRRFYARSLVMAATIRHNAAMFAAAAASVLGEQRAGDQIGTLLAGAFSLWSDDKVSAEQAEAWVKRQDWAEQKEEAASQSDEAALWQYLVEQRVRVGSGLEMSVGRLIEYAASPSELDAALAQPGAREALASYGMKLADDGGSVWVSNTHAQIKKLLTNTAWAHNWGRVLRRLPSAEASPHAVYFGVGSLSRAVRVPVAFQPK